MSAGAAVARTLISLHRRIENEQRSAYDTAWVAFRDAAVALGAKAWRFSAADDEELYLEFLEFKADADPRRDPQAARALLALEELAGGRAEEWVDANIQ